MFHLQHPFEIEIDASEHAMGAILMQGGNTTSNSLSLLDAWNTRCNQTQSQNLGFLSWTTYKTHKIFQIIKVEVSKKQHII